MDPSPSLKSDSKGRPVISRVRHADHELLSTLEALDLEAFGPVGLRVCDLAVVLQAGAIYVSRVDDEIVAGCQVLRMKDEPEFFYMVGFYVRPRWRGRGYGRVFLDGVREELERAGAAGMVLTVAPENDKARGLYMDAGFVDESYVRDFYGKGEDRHIMRWRFG